MELVAVDARIDIDAIYRNLPDEPPEAQRRSGA
jgi:hypothetical protein